MNTVKFLATGQDFVQREKHHGHAPGGRKVLCGKVNEEITVTFEQPGIYGFSAFRTYGMGMVAYGRCRHARE